ncbi:putative Transmembrane protein [Cocos nucifera]|uniref:Putative Transmembrane protein n=1 Tax=Cocos nucifera TaxID=13894 RepID=A0A8K0HXU9_COCNU|nr:putative Transmembrane protein [Cocos nucifera]
MPTRNEITADIHQMGGQASGPDDGRRPVSTFEWIGAATKGVGSACFHALTGPAAGPLLFACICAALAYVTKRRAGKRVLLHRSVSIAALHGGDMALERILDAQEARVHQEALDNVAKEMQKLLDKDPKDISYRELHRLAARLEMSRKEDDAIKMLQKKVQEAEKNKRPHEAQELQMLLVEMLIYKGDYQQALNCKCLEDKEISDARRPLYKTIIYSITGDRRARQYYEEFRGIRSRFHLFDCLDGTPLYGVVHDFDNFVKTVANLKKEIEHARTN